MFKSILDNIQSGNTKLLGTVVSVSTAMGTKTVPKRALLDALKDSPDIPNEWLPSEPTPLSMFLSTVASESKRSVKKLIISDPSSFDIETHVRYNVDRIKYDSTDVDKPVIFRVQHFSRSTVETADGELPDVKHNADLLMALTYNNGAYKVEAEPVYNNGSIVDPKPEDIAPFMPLIETVHNVFTEKMNGRYGGKEVSKIVKDILVKTNADLLHRGLYYLRGPQSMQVSALADVLKSVAPDVSVLTIPITDANDSLGSAVKQQVSVSLADSLMRQFAVLQSELTEMEAKHKETTIEKNSGIKGVRGVRSSSWAKKLEELTLLKEKLNEYKNHFAINKDILETQLDAAVASLQKIATEV